MRICIIYDCLFPYTVGGAERWYRNLSEQLAVAGHEVTYLTLRQWSKTEVGQVPGVNVVSVGPRMALYSASGQRRILPPIIFGLGVFWWLLWRPGRYDVVHTASFPYFSLLSAGVLRHVAGYRLVVDWHEFWSRNYWGQYLGHLAGKIGWAVQLMCLHLPQTAFCFANLTGARLKAAGLCGDVFVLEGEYAGSLEVRVPQPADPLVVFAGRHIADKRPAATPAAIGVARKVVPDLKARIFGDGPERKEVLKAIHELGLGEVVDAPGFVALDELEHDLDRALCLLAPSSREGYGLIVVEASARGVPTILVRGEDNAATELIVEGVNGFIADAASAADMGAAIIKVWKCGPALRRSTADWFGKNAQRLSLSSSLAKVLAAYSATKNGSA
jgi:glycosyltransferase involved in cell wall biosynthesis